MKAEESKCPFRLRYRDSIKYVPHFLSEKWIHDYGQSRYKIYLNIIEALRLFFNKTGI